MSGFGDAFRRDLDEVMARAFIDFEVKLAERMRELDSSLPSFSDPKDTET